jgi:hypothetical protein
LTLARVPYYDGMNAIMMLEQESDPKMALSVAALTVDTICQLQGEAQDADDHPTVVTCYIALGYHYKVGWTRATELEIWRAKCKIVQHLDAVKAMENV